MEESKKSDPSGPTDPGAADPTDPDSSGKAKVDPTMVVRERATVKEDAEGRMRMPTQAEIKNAVDAVPTVQDEERPNIPVPSYLKEEGADDAPGFGKGDPSAPTEPVESVVKPEDRPPPPASVSSTGPVIALAVLMVVALVAFLLMRGSA